MSDEKSFSVCQRNVAVIRDVVKYCATNRLFYFYLPVNTITFTIPQSEEIAGVSKYLMTSSLCGFGGSFEVGSHRMLNIWVKLYHCVKFHTGLLIMCTISLKNETFPSTKRHSQIMEASGGISWKAQL